MDGRSGIGAPRASVRVALGFACALILTGCEGAGLAPLDDGSDATSEADAGSPEDASGDSGGDVTPFDVAVDTPTESDTADARDGGAIDTAAEATSDVMGSDAVPDSPPDVSASLDVPLEAAADVATVDAGLDSPADVGAFDVIEDLGAQTRSDAASDAIALGSASDATVPGDASDAIAPGSASDAVGSGDASDAGSGVAAPPAFGLPSGCGLIAPGQGLARGQTFSSCDGRFTLNMQTDGNLVFYAGATPLWHTHTNGTDGAMVVMQTDGNFVLYDTSETPLWSSATGNSPGAYLELQNDGNLVVYGPGVAGANPLWYSATSLVPPPPSGCGVVQAPQGLVAGESFSSCDGRFDLEMQTDGNLVLYEGTTPLWNSQTFGTRGWEAIMQADGDFVVYDFWSRLWHSATQGNPGSYLKVQDDGNLVVYSAQNVALWNAGSCCH